MSSARVTIPPDLRDPVRRELLSLYAVKAEALHVAVETALAEGEVQPVAEHRTELDAIAAVIDRFGWGSETTGESLELEAERWLLREGLVGALSSEVEALNDCTEGKKPDAVDIDDIRRRLQTIGRLVDLVAPLMR
jgi:hypothetical protein